MPNRFRLGFRRETITALNSSLGGSRRYFDKVMDVAPANLIGYWPMNEGGGATSFDYSSQANNGTYTGVEFGAPGIVDGWASIRCDGTTDRNNIFSAALATDFSGQTGTLSIWAGVDNSNAWSDAGNRYVSELNSSSGNRISILRATTASTITLAYRTSGTLRFVNISNLNTLDFVQYGISWSNTASRVIFYMNGEQTGASALPPQFNDTLVVALWGAQTAAGAGPWLGTLAHGTLFNAELSPEAVKYIGKRN